jgi:hypothetical protein
MDESNGKNFRTNLHLILIELNVSIIEDFDKDEHFNINLLVSQRYLIGSGGQVDSTFSIYIGVDFSNPSAVRRQLACSEFHFLWCDKAAEPKKKQPYSIFALMIDL